VASPDVHIRQGDIPHRIPLISHDNAGIRPHIPSLDVADAQAADTTGFDFRSIRPFAPVDIEAVPFSELDEDGAFGSPHRNIADRYILENADIDVADIDSRQPSVCLENMVIMGAGGGLNCEIANIDIPKPAD